MAAFDSTEDDNCFTQKIVDVAITMDGKTENKRIVFDAFDVITQVYKCNKISPRVRRALKITLALMHEEILAAPKTGGTRRNKRTPKPNLTKRRKRTSHK